MMHQGALLAGREENEMLSYGLCVGSLGVHCLITMHKKAARSRIFLLGV